MSEKRSRTFQVRYDWQDVENPDEKEKFDADIVWRETDEQIVEFFNRHGKMDRVAKARFLGTLKILFEQHGYSYDDLANVNLSCVENDGKVSISIFESILEEIRNGKRRD